MRLDDFFRDSSLNMYLSWLITFSIAAVFVESILGFDILWILFSGLMLAVILLPVVAYRDPRVMLPWELTLIGSIPVIVRTMDISLLSNEIATYFAMAALALMIAVELHIFTKVKFNHSFAVGFTVVGTLALAGIWSVLRYSMDVYMGTSFLTTNEALMGEFINSTAAGLLAGIIFDTYFTRRDKKFRKMIGGFIRR